MLFYLVIILCLYLPFQVALNLGDFDVATLRVIVPIVFLIWLSESFRTKKIRIKNNIAVISFFSFIFLSLFSVFFAQNIEWSARKLIYLLTLFPLYLVVSDMVSPKDRVKKIMKALVISGGAVSLLGIIQFFSQFIFGIERMKLFWAHYIAVLFFGQNLSEAVLGHLSWFVNISGQTLFRAIATFPDPHMFSLYLGLLFPVSLGLFFSVRQKKWALIASVILLADILTFSRGAYLGLMAGLLAAPAFFWDKIEPKFKKTFLALIILGGLVFAIPGPIANRLFSSLDPLDNSNQGRREMWSAATREIFNEPLIGTGLGNFPLKVNPLAEYRDPIYAHNTYLDIAAETGIPSALAWIALGFFSFIAFLKKAKRDILFFGPAVGIVIFFTHSLFETGIYSPIVLTLYLIILAFANYEEKND